MNWFAFRAYNAQTAFGFGSEEEAREYCEYLNRGRDINLYAEYAVSDEDATEMGLENNTEAFNICDELIGLKSED